MIDFSKILFLDIETVSQEKTFDQLNERMQKLWSHKAEQIGKGDENATPESLYGSRFRLKSFCDHDEKALLKEFAAMLDRYYNTPDAQLCAHNGKEFDFPYIARRMLINGIQIPRILQVAGKKPWETNFLDTMEFWKFGDYKSYTSLDLLCAILDIPTPKDDINGSEVGRVYWQENDLHRIQTYCQKDVLAIAQLMRRYNYLPLITEDQVDYTN